MIARRRFLAVALTLCALGLGGAPVEAAKKDERAPPPTRRTQVIGQKVFKELEKAQAAADARDYPAALAVLDEVKAGWDKLNDYEKAMLWNFYAAIHYGMDDTAKAIDAYFNVLKQENLPEGLRNNALFAVAQLYFVTEEYDKALKILNRWFEVVAEVQPDAYMLRAQAHYQRQDYKAAEQDILEALRKARERGQAPKESWLALLRAVYYELQNYPRAAKVLELLVAHYPNESYWLQLSGMYGLMGRQKEQMAVLRAAYEAGMLSREGDILNLARLYLAEDAPYPAMQVLKTAFENKKIRETVDTLQLYAQALSFAQEYDAQIPVLEKLAQKSGQGRHSLYLGQAQAALGNWPGAAEAYRAALADRELERPGSARVMLGTALYNAKQYSQARAAFLDAQNYKDTGPEAENWVEFVSKEIQRQQFVAAQQNGGG